MTVPQSTTAGSDDDLARATETVAAKLRARGITVTADDSPADIVAMLEGVEAFEEAVKVAGGDLMVDEPPAGSTPQPDDPRFELPLRRGGEKVSAYLERLSEAEDLVADAAE